MRTLRNKFLLGNKDKCDAISTNPNSGGIRFINGEKVKRKNETKYLGCKLNYKSDLNVELGKRISETTYTWKNLNHFWKHSDCSKATKIHVYDAVIKSKLLYGLDTANLTPGMRTRIDRFQIKGLRQILGMDTTWAQKKRNEDMTNKHTEVIKKAEEALNQNRQDRLHEYELKCREHYTGIATHTYEDVTPPKNLWKHKTLKLAS